MSRFDSPVSVPALGESDGGDCVVCFLNLGFSVGGQLGLGRAAVETRAEVGMMEMWRVAGTTGCWWNRWV